MARAIPLLLILMAILGCESGPAMSSVDRARERWIDRQGGFACAASDQRLGTAAASVTRVCGTPVHLRVLAREAPGAWSWPGGAVFVSSGLLSIATDDELAAAVAHEIGHLHAEDTHDHALAGTHNALDPEVDPEVAADAEALRLLTLAGSDVNALGRLLDKVRQHPQTPPASRAALQARRNLLP